MAKIRAIKGYENLTDQEVIQILDSLKMLALITFENPPQETPSDYEK